MANFVFWLEKSCDSVSFLFFLYSINIEREKTGLKAAEKRNINPLKDVLLFKFYNWIENIKQLFIFY